MAVSYAELHILDWIQTHLQSAGADRFSAMQYLIFGPNDQVVLRGFTEEACLICDGNPYFLPSDRFEVRYEPALARTIKL